METNKIKFMKNSCSIRDNYMFLYKHASALPLATKGTQELPLIEHEFFINKYS